jgi:hypothetical protein
MKKFIASVLFIISSSLLLAQAPDMSAQCKEQMKKLSYLAGEWKGEAIHKSAKGQSTIIQTEHIEWKLQGLVLTIEGTGKQKNADTSKDEIVFQAFAVIHFDLIDQQFKFKSYVKEGYTTNAYFKVLEENKFEWGFDIPTGGKTKYIIILDPVKKTWHETGEYSRDGTQWFPFIELNLEKQNG